MNTLPVKSNFEKILESDLSQTKELILSNANLNCEKIILILEKMTHNSNLLVLDLSYNPMIGRNGGIALAKFLKINRKLKSLNLKGTRFDSEGLGTAAVVESLQELSELQELVLGSREMSKETSETFADFFAKNTTLEKLFLSGFFFYNYVVHFVIELLKSNKSLKVLDLGLCNLTDEDAHIISEALFFNDTLTDLNLEDNNISDSGAIAIFNALKVNTTLTSLNLNSKYTSNACSTELGDALSVNTALTSLTLSNRFTKIFDLSGVLDKLGPDSGLTSLKFLNYVFSLDEFIKIAETLSKNCTLKTLHISCNELNRYVPNKLAVQTIASLLESNYTLIELHVFSTGIDFYLDVYNELIRLDSIEKIIERNKLNDRTRFMKVYPLNMN